jgi:hypothetical protein
VNAKSPCRFHAGFLPDATAGGLSPDIDRALGEIAVAQIWVLEKKRRRVSAYSTVFPELAPRAD